MPVRRRRVGWTPRITVAAASFAALAACTEYSSVEDRTAPDTIVRHHFGYVKIVSPAVSAPGTKVRVLDVSTVGAWLNIDHRPNAGRLAGSGGGFGYRHDRREVIPLDCRVVVRLQNDQQMKAFLDALKAAHLGEDGICAVQDSSL